jgi:hypothetical protein
VPDKRQQAAQSVSVVNAMVASYAFLSAIHADDNPLRRASNIETLRGLG